MSSQDIAMHRLDGRHQLGGPDDAGQTATTSGDRRVGGSAMHPALRLMILLIALLMLSAPALGQTGPDTDAVVGAEDEAYDENDEDGSDDDDEADDDEDEYEDEYEDDEEDYDDLYETDAGDVFDPSSVEEIIIEGAATGASAQSEPAAITDFSQSELDNLGIVSVEDLALNTPSLHVGQFGDRPVVTLRGVGTANLTTQGEPGIGFVVDGIYQGRPSAANADFYDLRGVFVDRGPVGVQGGRQTNGGRITLQSQPPTDELDFFGDVEFGNYDSYVARGVANVPIFEEKLMSRATVTFRRRDGYQQNLRTGVSNDGKDDARNLATRLQLRSLWDDDRLETRVLGYYSYQKGNGPGRHLLNNPPLNTDTTIEDGERRGLDEVVSFRVPDCPTGEVDACFDDDPRTTWESDIGFIDNSSRAVTAIVNYDLPLFGNSSWFSDMRVGAVGGWIGTDNENEWDLDTTNSPSSYISFETLADQGSVEVFIERPDIDKFNFKVGAYYFRETVDTEFCVDANAQAVQPIDLIGQSRLLNQSIAGYAHAGYRVFDNLRLTAGIRYTIEKKEATQLNRFYKTIRLDNEPPGQERTNPFDCSTRYANLFRIEEDTPPRRNIPEDDPNATARFIQDDRSGEWKQPTPQFGFDWQVTDTSLIAFNFSNGFKAGGFPLGQDTTGLGSLIPERFEEEIVTEYELTFKNELFDRRVQLNITAFWMDYDPFQVCQIIGAVFVCNDEGRATTRGIEIEFLGEPIDNLRINGHFNFLDARIDRLWLEDPTDVDPGVISIGPVQPSNLEGNFLQKAPVYAGSFGIEYGWQLGRWGVLTPRVQTQFQSKTFFREFNKEEFSQDLFARVDLSLTWRSEDDRFTVRGYVNNVTDVDVINFLFVGPQGIGAPTTAQYMPPLTWGIRLGINFTNDLFY